MARRSLILALTIVLVLAACAPDNLDITPSPVPTATPSITVYVIGAVATPGAMVELPAGSRAQDAIEAAGGALDTADLERVNLAQLLSDGAQVNVPAVGEETAVQEVTQEAAPVNAASAERTLLDHLVNGIPAEIVAGSQWKRGFAQECKTRDEIVYQEPDGGVVASLCYGEAVGGLSYVIIGAFASPEAAEAYYQLILGRTRTLDGAEERDSVGNFTFPKPNAFGGGTYGSDAIFLKDNLFIQVSVPRFSSTSGEPLNPMARAVLRAVDDALATYQG